jgi:hypothetical protein
MMLTKCLHRGKLGEIRGKREKKVIDFQLF